MPSLYPTPDCDESDGKYLYKMIMFDTGGDGWDGVTYYITTAGVTRFTGTLDDGFNGVHYYCMEDNIHSIVVNGTSDTMSEICFEFDDPHGDAFRGCAPILDVFHTSQGEVFGAPSSVPTAVPSPTVQPEL